MNLEEIESLHLRNSESMIYTCQNGVFDLELNRLV